MKITGTHILSALKAAELLPNLSIEKTQVCQGCLILSSGAYSFELSFEGGGYSVTENNFEGPVFGLKSVGLQTAFDGICAIIKDLRTPEAARYPIERYAAALEGQGRWIKVLGGDVIRIVHIATEEDHAAWAQRDWQRPWLWEVQSGDMASDYCLKAGVMSFAKLREATEEFAI